MFLIDMNIYFLRSGQHIKIGHANNVEKRIKIFQTGNPHNVELIYKFYCGQDCKKIEAKLHKYLRTYRVNGEWFRSVKLIYSIVDTIKMDGINHTLGVLDICYRFFDGSDYCYFKKTTNWMPK